MKQFRCELHGSVVHVVFDSGGMNTLSSGAIKDLADAGAEVAAIAHSSDVKGVLLFGNRFGLGAGADINELMTATRRDLAGFVDRGHQVLQLIETSSIPWLAVVDGVCLGGIYELALACHGIIATKNSTIGFPEIMLNIFPGLGGTQRMPRRSGLLNTADPIKGDAGFTAVLTGKYFKAEAASAINMIDAVIPDGVQIEEYAERWLLEILPNIVREVPADLANAEALKPMVLPTIQKATMGRLNPRAPYVALDVMCKGAGLPLDQALRLERDAFLDVATSAEGQAGMRFFFAKQSVEKAPRDWPPARQLNSIGVAGIDGFMGNAIAWLCLQARMTVVGYVPPAALKAMGLSLDQVRTKVREKLIAKYARLVKSRKLSEEQVAALVATVIVTDSVLELDGCSLVIEALAENRDVKEDFLVDLAAKDFRGIVASNSSSMGPSVLASSYTMGGGDDSNLIGLHFFSPAEDPRRMLVEIVVGKKTAPEVVATAHAFVRKIGKTPVVVQDGSTGFLVNAGLAAYMLEAERLYLEGTPIEVIDDAMREIFPMGPFELGDYAGLDVAGGMFEQIIEAGEYSGPLPLICRVVDKRRLGIKSGGGYYDYADGKKGEVWSDLHLLAGKRGNSVATADEIRARCGEALFLKAKELVGRGIVSSAEVCDLGFVLGIGFAMHRGGPIYNGQQQGWDQE